LFQNSNKVVLLNEKVKNTNFKIYNLYILLLGETELSKKKFYAVKVGKLKGIFESWAECKEQVDGYKGAIYKSFTTKEEAEIFIGESSTNVPTNNSNLDIEGFIKEQREDTLVAFVDGSYDSDSQVYGFGVVLVNKDGDTEEIIGSDNNKAYVDTRNVAGEIEGVQSAITQAVGKGYKKIAIFYDYMGIEKWATGEWRAKTPIAKDYVTFIREMKRCIDLEFHKVKAHSGIKFNEKADELARKSLLKKGIKNNSDGCVTITGIDKDEFRTIFEILVASNSEIKIEEAGISNKSTNFILSLFNDKIVVTCYRNGTTTIQGKQSSLLEELMVLIVELLPNNGEVIELLNDYHEIKIGKDSLVARFNHLLPHFDKSKTNDQKLINTLNQAVYNTMLKGERPDYTDLATPSLRALEYYLYKIFISKAIMDPEDKNYGFGYFETVDGYDSLYKLQKAHEIHFSSEELSYVNELYNFYRNNRHTLSHWDKDSETTRILKTMEEARSLIVSNLELINKYYYVF
jgi:ribonuclease H-related protein